MWITPRPFQKYIKDMFWTVLDESGFLQLLKHKSTGTFLDNVISTVRSVNPLEKQPLTYRIVIYNKFDETIYILAVSDSETTIRKHWKQIIEEFIPNVYGARDKKVIDNEEDFAKQEDFVMVGEDDGKSERPKQMGHTTAALIEEEVIQYLFSKVSSLAQLEEGEEYKNMEAAIEGYHQLFSELYAEKLLTYYPATLWVMYPRQGTLYVTENYLCFHSPNLQDKVVIPFKDITSISKDSYAMGLLNNSIRITTSASNNEHSFAFIRRDTVYILIERLWKQTMQRILNNTSVESDPTAATQTNVKFVDAGTSKKQIDDSMKNEDFQKRFKLKDEDLLEEFVCSFWRHNTYIVGKIYITANFLCYQSNFTVSGKDIKIVIALNEVTSIDKKSLSFGFLQNALTIKIKGTNELFFALVSRNLAYDLLIKLWKTRPALPPESPLVWDAWSLDENYVKSKNEAEEKRQFEMWLHYFERNGDGISMARTPKLKLLLREGIPDALRGKLWQIISGSRHKYQARKNYYQDLLKHYHGKMSEAVEEIEKDVHRALPNHPFFQDEERGVKMLRNVLIAFSWRNPHIGYCQAMNIIAALFLLYMPEEEAFWMLCTVCEDILPEYYTKELLGSQVDQYIFNSLVSNNLSSIDYHLKRISLPINLISLPWFMCLFITYIPWKAALRFIDCFLLDGADVLFQVGLAALKLNETEVLEEFDSERVIHLLRTREYDCDLLIKTAFTDFGALPIERMNEIRNQQKYQAIKYLEDSKKKKQLQSVDEGRSTKFSMDELEDIYDKFKSVLPPDTNDFVIDMEQCQILFQFYLSKTQANWWDYTLPRIFRIWDKNADGRLDYPEFVQILSIAIKGMIVDKYQLCFKLTDTDEDNKINKVESQKLLKILYRMCTNQETSKDFSDFVEMTWTKAGMNENDLITCEQMQEIIINKPLLSSYWNLDDISTN